MTNVPSAIQEGVVGVEILEQAHGCQEGRAQGKSHDKSKAASVDALEPRIDMFETSISTIQDTLDTLEVMVDGLEGEYGEFMVATKALMQYQVDSLRGDFRAFHDEL